ncbi:MAG: hypothetical protein DRJ61_18285 [Acidobacteria bacterium]|nr:MAG: hypothetical protein DRJ61_18285 [Acidobacteriota bacterium]
MVFFVAAAAFAGSSILAERVFDLLSWFVPSLGCAIMASLHDQPIESSFYDAMFGRVVGRCDRNRVGMMG